MFESKKSEDKNGNKNNFKKYIDEEEEEEPEKEKKRKKPKNKNIKANLQDEFVKKGDENEYLGNQNIKIIIDDSYSHNGDTINFKTAFSYFCSFEYKEEQDLIDNELIINKKKISIIKRICSCLCKKIPQNIKKEKNLICCITKVPYDEENEIHYKILKSIYLFFTKEKECPKKGSHWEKIGFQSNTPKSDLRSVGMLASLQTLYFLCAYPSFSLSVYQLFLIFSMHSPIYSAVIFSLFSSKYWFKLYIIPTYNSFKTDTTSFFLIKNWSNKSSLNK